MVKNLPAGSIPGLGRSPGEGNGSPFQHSCREFQEQRRLAGYRPWDCKELDMTETNTYTFSFI